jgi:hypothetical protein
MFGAALRLLAGWNDWDRSHTSYEQRGDRQGLDNHPKVVNMVPPPNQESFVVDEVFPSLDLEVFILDLFHEVHVEIPLEDQLQADPFEVEEQGDYARQ